MKEEKQSAKNSEKENALLKTIITIVKAFTSQYLEIRQLANLSRMAAATSSNKWFLRVSTQLRVVSMVMILPFVVSATSLIMVAITDKRVSNGFEWILHDLKAFKLIRAASTFIEVLSLSDVKVALVFVMIGLVWILLVSLLNYKFNPIAIKTRKLRSLLKEHGVEYRFVMYTDCGTLIDLVNQSEESLRSNTILWANNLNDSIGRGIRHPEKKSVYFFPRGFELKTIYNYKL